MSNRLGDLIAEGKRELYKAQDRLTPFGLDPLKIRREPFEEPQRSYLWEVSVLDSTSDNFENLKFYAKATGVPSHINDVIKRTYCGVEYAYPGRDNSPRIFRVTFWDNQSLEVYRYMNHWATLCNGGPTRIKADPVNYKRDIQLDLLDTTNKFQTGIFLMKGCFPMEISEASLTYVDSTEITFDVMFHFTDKKIL